MIDEGTVRVRAGSLGFESGCGRKYLTEREKKYVKVREKLGKEERERRNRKRRRRKKKGNVKEDNLKGKNEGR